MDNHTIKHKDIINQESDVRLLSVSKDGLRKLSVFARHPTLDDFTSLSPRRVAPIYATYASTMTSLLDIHVEPPSVENDPERTGAPSFEILEAGTGHGSLTLQLARAIAAANPPATSDIKPVPSSKTIYKAGEEVEGNINQPESDALIAWRKQRRAIRIGSGLTNGVSCTAIASSGRRNTKRQTKFSNYICMTNLSSTFTHTSDKGAWRNW